MQFFVRNQHRQYIFASDDQWPESEKCAKLKIVIFGLIDKN